MECDNIHHMNRQIKMRTRKHKPHIVHILTFGLILVVLSTNAAASDWFVRPVGGEYGDEDGTSYDNAWDGLLNVVWGEGGVVAGDTLYICDTHINTRIDNDATAYYWSPGASGSEGNYITIKGHPDHPAIIWNAYIDGRPGGIDPESWTEPNVAGCYYNDTSDHNKLYTSHGLFEGISGDTFDNKYTKLDSAVDVINSSEEGVFFAEEFGTNQGRIWLRPFHPSTFADNLYFSGTGGYTLRIGSEDADINYIKYEDITFMTGRIHHNGPCHDYTFENCKFLHSCSEYLYIPEDANYVTFDGCEFAHGGNGIYVIWDKGANHHLYIQNCYFHHFGNAYGPPGSTYDGHAIGIQNNEYFYITGNRFENCSSAIVFHIGEVPSQKHCYVTGNYITGMKTGWGKVTQGYGIHFQGDNNSPKENQDDYLIAYNIVFDCEGQGITSTRKGTVKMYNNFVSNCATNYKIVGIRENGASAEFYNNISVSPAYSAGNEGTYHFYFDERADPDDFDFACDNNLYYPADTEEYFLFRNSVESVYNTTATFAEWKACHLAAASLVVDENSLTIDPKFVNYAGNYFLQFDSPAIDAGFDVGLTQDFQGKFVPQGSAPDIGAYEYTLNPVTDLAATGISQNSVSLSWTMPSDDGLASMPSHYDIRYATSLITEDNWDTATQVQGEPAPEDFGVGRSFTISGLTPGTTYYIAIKTSNETGSTSSPLSNVISQTTATTGNFAPVLTSIGDKSLENNEYLTFTVSATDADVGDTLTYSATDLPLGASFNTTTHIFEWTPTDSQGGTYHVTFQVTDGSVAVTETIRIVVNEAPVLAAIGNKSVSEGSTLSFTISATDPDGDAITYSATDLPTGAAFAGRTFTWTPSYTQAGTYNVTFAATDGIAQDSETITITVNNTNRAPVLDAIGDKYANEDMPLQFDISATEPDGEAVVYSAAGLPTGATFVGQTFTWTPSAGNVGNNYPVTFTATDGQLSDSETVNITVINDNTAPSVSNLSPAANSIQAPLNSLIILHVTDAGGGVDAGSVTITLDGDTIYTGDSSDYSSATGNCRRSGTKADYTYAYQSSELFDFDQSKTVTVNAADLVGNVMTERTYSFRTEMRSFGQNIRVDTTVQGINKATPSTARDSNGNIWAVWHAGPAGSRNIYIAKLRADRNTFSASVRLTSSIADQANPVIALGTDNKLYVAWQDKRNGDWDIYSSTSVDGANWTTQTRVNDPNEGNQTNPAIVVGSQSPNYAYIAWQDDHAGNQDICIASSNDSFGTKTVSQITSNTANQTGPAIAVDSANTVYVLWTDARNATSDIYGAAGGTWTNVPIVTKAGSQSNPVIAVESAGTILHMLWADQISGNSDIYYASSDGLPSNALAGINLIDDTLGKEQVSPSIAVIGSTGDDLEVFACWRDERNISDTSGDTDIYMVQTNSGVGTNVFVGDGDTNSDQIEPAMSTDQYGYPYLVWTDYRTANKEIYFAGSVYLQSVPLVSELTTASEGGTVGTAPGSITDEEDVSVVVPAGACPYDVTISITKIENQHEYGSLPFLNGYDFGPSGITFNTPVTVTIPYAVTGDEGTPTVYWYDSRAWYDPLSQQGITDIETIVITSSLHALRFKTTHFTPFYVVLGPAIATIAETVSSSDGGGGGGGCSLSHSRDGSILEYFLPYGALALCMIILKRRDRRYIKRL